MANGIKLRSWTIQAEDYRDDYGNDTGFRQAIRKELADIEHMAERLGVGFVCGPARRQMQDGEYETVAWVFQTETIPPTKMWAPEPIEMGDENEGTPLEEGALVEDFDALAEVE